MEAIMNPILIRTTLGLFATMLLSLVSHVAPAEEVRRQEIGFQINYDDGYWEKMNIIYSAVLEHTQWQTGRASKPLEGHFIDDRRCHWQIDAKVHRTVCGVSRSVGQSCDSEYSQVFYAPQRGSGHPWSITRIQGENCNRAQAGINAQVAGARRDLINQFDGIVGNDLERFVRFLEDRPKVATVNQLND